MDQVNAGFLCDVLNSINQLVGSTLFQTEGCGTTPGDRINFTLFVVIAGILAVVFGGLG